MNRGIPRLYHSLQYPFSNIIINGKMTVIVIHIAGYNTYVTIPTIASKDNIPGSYVILSPGWVNAFTKVIHGSDNTICPNRHFLLWYLAESVTAPSSQSMPHSAFGMYAYPYAPPCNNCRNICNTIPGCGESISCIGIKSWSPKRCSRKFHFKDLSFSSVPHNSFY